MMKKLACATMAVGVLLFTSAAPAAPYTGMYVFGDSLSDTGNLYGASGGTVPGPSTAYTQGRFTNALNYVDGLAAGLGLSAAPSILGGTNFAWGGARTTTHFLGSFASIAGQVNSFISATGGGPKWPNASE